ncbi:hypothetical protein GRF29_154g805120 [Pseudopithomyces chartarum]|uniref:Uncharacterized protein n=1 Tax=Pseudopithomyces chartarum TaxID=1892770 RepID=A0AAN6LU53_9PLEO|nr:hypothetical protein GRF29_154g805120 [Pseudopithomyces chartarum]
MKFTIIASAFALVSTVAAGEGYWNNQCQGMGGCRRSIGVTNQVRHWISDRNVAAREAKEETVKVDVE